jgi:O-antigen/teichoic acid export membrane protein
LTLYRHSLLNIVGAIAPVLVGVACLGFIARQLTADRFGLLLMAWAFLTFGLVLDLGLARAVTHAVSVRKGDDERQVAALLVTSLTVAASVATVALVFILLGAFSFVYEGQLGSSTEKDIDAAIGFVLVAAALVPSIPNVILQGYWEGINRFRESNLQRIWFGVLPNVCSAVAVAYSATFSAAAFGILVGRAVALLFALADSRVRTLLRRRNFELLVLRRLFRYGGWITVSALASALMSYMDRFLLASLKGPTETAYYAAPVDLAIRMLVVPVSITRSLFPKIASSKHPGTESRLLTHTTLAIAAIVPIAAGVAWWAPEILGLWLGESYRQNATEPLRILMLGFVFSSFAQVPYTRLLSMGAASTIAKVHVTQLVPFVALAAYLMSLHGAVGAAWAWTVRSAIDMAMMEVYCRRAAADRHVDRGTALDPQHN